MNILFDFLHPVDVNFFRNAIKILQEENHKIYLTFRDRGPVGIIIKKEFPNIKATKIGEHKTSFFSKIMGQFIRDYHLIKYIRKNKINIGLSFGPSIGLACRLSNVPFISFADDPEYKLTLYHALLFANKLVMPAVKNLPFKVITYNGYKELAYLHPDYYEDKLTDLVKYQIEPNEYVFIREVSNVSLNYKNKLFLNCEIIKKLKEKGIKIVMSLEDKSQKNSFKKDCIILEEPINNIHAIIKNALFTISSGDTVARESCLIGTPTIYIGGRDMRINEEFINMELMMKTENIKSILVTIDKFTNKSYKGSNLIKLEEKIRNSWDSPTDVILNSIKEYNYL